MFGSWATTAGHLTAGQPPEVVACLVAAVPWLSFLFTIIVAVSLGGAWGALSQRQWGAGLVNLAVPSVTVLAARLTLWQADHRGVEPLTAFYAAGVAASVVLAVTFTLSLILLDQASDRSANSRVARIATYGTIGFVFAVGFYFVFLCTMWMRLAAVDRGFHAHAWIWPNIPYYRIATVAVGVGTLAAMLLGLIVTRRADRSRRRHEEREAAERTQRIAREAAERARQEEAAREAAERARQEEDARRAAERARQEQAAREAAERAKQEEDARRAADPEIQEVMRQVAASLERLSAARVLVAKSPPDIPALMLALRDEDKNVRNIAATRLAQIGLPVVDDLASALSDPSWAVRWLAAKVLGQIGPPAQAAVPALRKAASEAVREALNPPRRPLCGHAGDHYLKAVKAILPDEAGSTG